MPAETEWLVGRKQIAQHLNIDETTLDKWRSKYTDFPVVVIHGEVRATKEKLNAWVYAHAENRCPLDQSLCPRVKCTISL